MASDDLCCSISPVFNYSILDFICHYSLVFWTPEPSSSTSQPPGKPQAYLRKASFPIAEVNMVHSPAAANLFSFTLPTLVTLLFLWLTFPKYIRHCHFQTACLVFQPISPALKSQSLSPAKPSLAPLAPFSEKNKKHVCNILAMWQPSPFPSLSVTLAMPYSNPLLFPLLLFPRFSY